MLFRRSTPEDVRWTYRLLLAREPEEHDIIEKLDQNVFVDDLVKFILNSKEYESRIKSFSAEEAAAKAEARKNEPIAPVTDGVTHFDDIAADDDAGFVDALYSRILGRQADAGGLEGHIALLKSGAMSRLQLIEAFMTSPEFVSRSVRVIIGRISTESA